MVPVLGELPHHDSGFRGVLKHWHHDTFGVRWADAAWRSVAGAGWITFRLDRGGDVEALELEAIPGERERLERAGS